VATAAAISPELSTLIDVQKEGVDIIDSLQEIDTIVNFNI
jgi:hypothetical protein